MGSRRKASATVAIIAVHTANNICIESKKKNMMRRDTDAPRGRHNACIVSRVCTSVKEKHKHLLSLEEAGVAIPSSLFLSFSDSLSLASCSKFRDLKLPYTMRRMEMRKVETREESTMEYAHWYSALRAMVALLVVSSSAVMCGASESQPLLGLILCLGLVG